MPPKAESGPQEALLSAHIYAGRLILGDARFARQAAL
jgi:hypothetical protein